MPSLAGRNNAIKMHSRVRILDIKYARMFIVFVSLSAQIAGEPAGLKSGTTGKRFWFWVTGEDKHSFSSSFCDFKHIDEET